MHISGKQLFMGAALSLILFTSQNDTFAGAMTKADLKAKVKATAENSMKLIDTVNNFHCYWEKYLGVTACTLHVSTCRKMVHDKETFSLNDYKKTLEQLQSFTYENIRYINKEIDQSKKTPEQLPAFVTQNLAGLYNGVRNSVDGLKQLVKPLQDGYKIIEGTIQCPKKI